MKNVSFILWIKTKQTFLANAILTELNKESDKNTVAVGKLSAPLTALDGSSKQKINKEIVALDQMGVIDFYRAFHGKTSGYKLFSSAQATFPRIDHMLGHKTSLGKFRRVKLYQA